MKNSEKANKRLDHCRFTSRLLFAAAALCVFTLISVATASANSSLDRPIAVTESGLVIGSTTDGGNEFLGIPYAAPPVGALRWRPPKPTDSFPDLFSKRLNSVVRARNLAESAARIAFS